MSAMVEAPKLRWLVSRTIVSCCSEFQTSIRRSGKGMSFSAAPDRGLEFGTAGNYRSADQPSQFWRFHHRRHLPPALADRSVFQNTETEPQNQNFRRHFRKRPADSDLDRVNRHAAAAMASLPIQTELVLFQSRIPIAHEPVHLSRPKRMARRSPRHPASRTSTTSAGLVLIGTAGVTQLVTSFSKPHF